MRSAAGERRQLRLEGQAASAWGDQGGRGGGEDGVLDCSIWQRAGREMANNEGRPCCHKGRRKSRAGVWNSPSIHMQEGMRGALQPRGIDP